jgi:protocatechuate 3,4-dioxygenase beta subunit
MARSKSKTKPKAKAGNGFRPYDDRTQPTRAIRGYPNTQKRTPARLFPRVVSLADVTGPNFSAAMVGAEEADLSRQAPGRPRALGQLITLSGRVLDDRGKPVPNCLIEIWHANSAGKYIHHNDPSPVPVDENFRGRGRVVTDAQGRYHVRTIRPGGYAVPDGKPGDALGWWRPPHIHLSLFGANFAARLVTQLYFPGDVLNEQDRILNSIPDKAARDRMICRYLPRTTGNSAEGDPALEFGHDLVLRGRFETPFEAR